MEIMAKNAYDILLGSMPFATLEYYHVTPATSDHHHATPAGPELRPGHSVGAGPPGSRDVFEGCQLRVQRDKRALPLALLSPEHNQHR